MKDQESGPGAPFDPDGHQGSFKVISAGPGAIWNGLERIEVKYMHAANRPRPEKRVSRAQLAMIHLAKMQTGVSDEDYREQFLFLFDGVRSAKDLSQEGVTKVLRAFAKIGFIPQTKGQAQDFGERSGGMASPGQVRLIRRLWTKWHGHDDERTLNHWLENRFHVAALRFVSAAVATMAIEGLKAMLARKGSTTTTTKE